MAVALDAIDAFKISTWLGAFGQRSLKPLGIFSTHPVGLATALLRVQRATAVAKVRSSEGSATQLTKLGARRKGKVCKRQARPGWGKGTSWVN
eukprot:7949521-Pyramimonas_sp.AAC.1